MTFSIIRSEEGFLELQREWHQLVKTSWAQSPFQNFEFLRAWWETCGGGEWARSDLWVGLSRTETGALRGIAPMFNTRDAAGRRQLHFLGANEVADYLDLITPADEAALVADEVLEAALADPDGPFDSINLNNLQEDSPGAAGLISAAQRRGIPWKYGAEQVCPYIPLHGDWETYLAGLKKKQRHEIRRKMRRVEESQQGETFSIIEDPEALRRYLPQFLDLMRKDDAKKDFLTEPMAVFFERLVEQGADSGWIRLAALTLDEQLAAAYLFFEQAGVIWLYNSAFEPELQHYSPGWVLLGRLIQWGFRHGMSELDFMRGDEEYKYRFGGINRTVNRLLVPLRAV